LCSTLAWQNKFATEAAKNKKPITLEYSSGKSHQSKDTFNKSTMGNKQFSAQPDQAHNVIVYSSRTHSQLAQVIRELKSTSYRPVTAVLGSREQLCVHDKLSKLRGSALNHACNSLNSKRGCSYRNNLDSLPGEEGTPTTNTMDIEELKVWGKREKMCPYFYSRELSTRADLVLLPYNYLLDSSIRATLQIDWRGAVIVFDEAHNIEKVAADASSFTMTTTEIAACIEELQLVVRLLREGERNNNSNQSSDKKVDNEVLGRFSLNSGPNSSDTVIKPTLEAAVALLKYAFEMEKQISSLPMSVSESIKIPSIVLPGIWFRNMAEAAGIKSAAVSYYFKLIS